MLINLYGDHGLIFQILATGFKEAHLQDKFKFEVVESEKVGSKFKEAVKKAYNAKFLDDADMVIRFAEANQSPTDDQQNQDDGQQTDGNKDDSKQTDDQQQGGDGGEKQADTNEAETSASGVDLKKKIVDTVKRCLFQEDAEKIELVDLEGYLEGYNVSFIKVSLKTKDDAVAAQN